MFGSKKNKNSRFYIKSDDQIPTLGRVTILVDRETGVNYIHTWCGSGSGLTALLDQNGETVVDK